MIINLNENKKKDHEKIRTILFNDYGLVESILSDAPQGFVADTCYAQSGEQKFFVKILKSSDNLEAGLPILLELKNRGINNINFPVPTKTGRLSVAFEERVLVLFNFVEGDWTFSYNFEKYADLIARLHAITNQVKKEVKKYNYDLPFLVALKESLNKISDLDCVNETEKNLKQIIVDNKDEFVEVIKRMQALSDKMKNKQVKLFITHGDAPSNIIKDKNGEVYLIDWDDLLLAPAERDTWFHVNTNQETEFLKTYKMLNPDYEIDFEACAFYLHRRYLDDLEGFISRILDVNSSEQQKKTSLRGLENDCLMWLGPRIQRIQKMI